VAARWQRPPKKGSSKTGQPQAAAAENGPDPLGTIFIFITFSPIKRFLFRKQERPKIPWEARAAEGQSLGIKFPGLSPLPPAFETGAQQGYKKGFAPVDWLYSKSLTKSIKSLETRSYRFKPFFLLRTDFMVPSSLAAPLVEGGKFS